MLAKTSLSTTLFYFLLSTLILTFSACENSLEEVKEMSEQLKDPIETIKNVKILYSEHANVRVELQAPLMLRHKSTAKPRLEFPEGLEVRFFQMDSLRKNAPSKIGSKLTANYGIRYEKEMRTVVSDNVIWRNEEKQEQIETEELIWNEKTKKIHSDKFVKITTPTESIFGEGFEADQDFTHKKIKKVTGTVQINPNQL